MDRILSGENETVSNVWFCIPSKRPAEEADPVLKQWRERGYSIALFLDGVRPYSDTPARADLRLYTERYPGYAVACNSLIAEVMLMDSGAEWFVTGGDDVLPDPNHSAEDIAEQCSAHFYNSMELLYPPDKPKWAYGGPWGEGGSGAQAGSYRAWATFGVMQPTGDRWGDKQGAYIDRVAGSPWIGREFAKRMYQGNGPYHHEYTHMGVDEELQAVATKLGVFWQRPDLIHEHRHWGKPRPGEAMGQRSRMPEFLERANSQEEWNRYKRIFTERQAAGFPGHEPL